MVPHPSRKLTHSSSFLSIEGSTPLSIKSGDNNNNQHHDSHHSNTTDSPPLHLSIPSYSDQTPLIQTPSKNSLSTSTPGGIHPFFTRLSARKAAAAAAESPADASLETPYHQYDEPQPSNPSPADSHSLASSSDSLLPLEEEETQSSKTNNRRKRRRPVQEEDRLLSQLEEMKKHLSMREDSSNGNRHSSNHLPRLTQRERMLRKGMSDAAHVRFLQRMVRQRRSDGATADESSLGVRFYSIAARIQKTVHFSVAPQPLDYTLFRNNKTHFLKSKQENAGVRMHPYRKNLMIQRVGKLSHKYAANVHKHKYLRKNTVPKYDNPRCWSRLTERNRNLLYKIQNKTSTLGEEHGFSTATAASTKSSKTRKNVVFSSPYIPSPNKTLPHEDTPFLKYIHHRQQEEQQRGTQIPAIPSKHHSAMHPYRQKGNDDEASQSSDALIEYTHRLLPMPIRVTQEPPNIEDDSESTDDEEEENFIVSGTDEDDDAELQEEDDTNPDTNNFFITQNRGGDFSRFENRGSGDDDDDDWIRAFPNKESPRGTPLV